MSFAEREPRTAALCAGGGTAAICTDSDLD
jgi:hypothetical protein